MLVDPLPSAARVALHRALGDPHRLAMADALAVSDRTPSELRELTGLGFNLLAFHLRTLEAAGVIERHASEGDRRRRYVRLRPGVGEQLRLAKGRPQPGRPLFICTHNSARSQFAAGLWRATTKGTALSAGSHPATRVHPLAVEAAAARGVDLSSALPRGYGDVAERPDAVVSVCDRALESGVPFGAPRIHWSVPDPAGGTRAAFDAAFADIAERLQRLVGSRA